MPLQVFFAILLMALGISQSQMVGTGARLHSVQGVHCSWDVALHPQTLLTW